MIDVLTRLLVSKGLITEAELARETAIVKSNEKYEFDVHDAEIDIEVFRAMLALCAKEEARMHGLVYTDDKQKKEDTCSSQI